MKRRIIVNPRADQDIDDQFAYLFEQVSLATAVRFLTATRQTFQQLAQTPDLGSLYEFQSPRLVGIRWWKVRGFKKHLVFYRPTDDGITVIRVLHAARNIARLFGDDV